MLGFGSSNKVVKQPSQWESLTRLNAKNVCGAISTAVLGSTAVVDGFKSLKEAYLQIQSNAKIRKEGAIADADYVKLLESRNGFVKVDNKSNEEQLSSQAKELKAKADLGKRTHLVGQQALLKGARGCLGLGLGLSSLHFVKQQKLK